VRPQRAQQVRGRGQTDGRSSRARASSVPSRESQTGVEEPVVEAEGVRDDYIRSLLASTSEGIYSVDLVGRCTFTNTAGAALLRYTPEEIVGHAIHPLIHHTRADGTPYPFGECPISAVMRTGETCHLDTEVLWCRDGSPLQVEYSANPIVQRGEVAGVVVTFRDITERKRAEAALEMMARQQAAAADLGLWALTDAPLPALVAATVNLAASILDVPAAMFLEMLPEGVLRVAASEGVTTGQLGVPAGESTLLGYVLARGEAVEVEDIASETRFKIDELLQEHGASSALAAAVSGPDGSRGVLVA